MTDTPTEWLEDETVRLVMSDLQEALNAAFEPVRDREPFGPAPGLPWQIGEEGTVAVAWEYRGLERFNPLARDWPRREVTVRGLTVVVRKGDEPLFHRYIDWAGVYDQLGMVPGRPSIGDAETLQVERTEGGAFVLIPAQD